MGGSGASSEVLPRHRETGRRRGGSPSVSRSRRSFCGRSAAAGGGAATAPSVGADATICQGSLDADGSWAPRRRLCWRRLPCLFRLVRRLGERANPNPCCLLYCSLARSFEIQFSNARSLDPQANSELCRDLLPVAQECSSPITGTLLVHIGCQTTETHFQKAKRGEFLHGLHR